MQYRIFLYLASACTFCRPAFAIDLEQLWASAKAESPEVLISHQNQEIANSEIQISLSKLLPSARYAYSYGDSTTERKNSGATAAQSQDYKLERKQFTISQPLFRMQEYFTLRQSLSNAKATDSESQQAISDFFIKISAAYFETANALEQYTLGKKRTAILNELYLYAQKSLKHGTGTRSDVDDAKAKLDFSLADQLERASALKNAERSLSALSGFNVDSENISSLDFSFRDYPNFTANDFENYYSLALENNPAIQTLSYRYTSASENVAAQQSAHLPTLDLNYANTDAQNDTESLIGAQTKTTSLTLQLNVPLFLGGQTIAQTNKASAQRSIAYHTLEQAKRKLRIDLSQEFSNLIQAPSRIRALETALESAESSLIGSKKGLQAGTRNIVDVLNAQQQIFNTQSQLIRTRCDLAISYIRFNQITGTNPEYSIQILSSWFDKKSPDTN